MDFSNKAALFNSPPAPPLEQVPQRRRFNQRQRLRMVLAALTIWTLVRGIKDLQEVSSYVARLNANSPRKTSDWLLLGNELLAGLLAYGLTSFLAYVVAYGTWPELRADGTKIPLVSLPDESAGKQPTRRSQRKSLLMGLTWLFIGFGGGIDLFVDALMSWLAFFIEDTSYPWNLNGAIMNVLVLCAHFTIGIAAVRIIVDVLMPWETQGSAAPPSL